MLSAVVRRNVLRAAATRTFVSNRSGTAGQSATRNVHKFLAVTAGAAATFYYTVLRDGNKTALQSAAVGSDVLMLGPTKEKSTGILFPQLCNGFNLVGTGVRIKYGLIKVYAVGTYMDPAAMMGIKNQPKETIEKALLDPMYPRTIRIVMARNLSIDAYNKAIVEALAPKMNGEDMDKLEEFKKLNPAIDLVKGAEIEMTIRGDTLLYKNALGGVGMIQSASFCKALCEIYYGSNPVSPTHKESVLEGVPKL